MNIGGREGTSELGMADDLVRREAWHSGQGNNDARSATRGVGERIPVTSGMTSMCD